MQHHNCSSVCCCRCWDEYEDNVLNAEGIELADHIIKVWLDWGWAGWVSQGTPRNSSGLDGVAQHVICLCQQC